MRRCSVCTSADASSAPVQILHLHFRLLLSMFVASFAIPVRETTFGEAQPPPPPPKEGLNVFLCLHFYKIIDWKNLEDRYRQLDGKINLYVFLCLLLIFHLLSLNIIPLGMIRSVENGILAQHKAFRRNATSFVNCRSHTCGMRGYCDISFCYRAIIPTGLFSYIQNFTHIIIFLFNILQRRAGIVAFRSTPAKHYINLQIKMAD
jgi:hypothetical protein